MTDLWPWLTAAGAGALHGHLHGRGLAESLPFASACAALTLTVPQANHPGLSVERVHHLQRLHAPP